MIIVPSYFAPPSQVTVITTMPIQEIAPQFHNLQTVRHANYFLPMSSITLHDKMELTKKLSHFLGVRGKAPQL